MQQTAPADRLQTLLGFLESDPDNAQLMLDAAAAALEAGDLEASRDLLDRIDAAGASSPASQNLQAIVAMRSGDAARAAELFDGLRQDAPDDAGLAFNAAWAHALAGDKDAARALLEPWVCEALPQAAMLDVQLIHETADLHQADEKARAYLARHGDYPPLLAAVSVLALDMEDTEFARDCAARAGEHPDAISTMGMLTLGDHQAEEAQAMFERALSINEHVPRAWLGLGLSKMAQGDHAAAAPLIEKGAGMFGTHLGSWIAAGWAHLLAGDASAAREKFEKSLDVDPNFAESHGSLAVIEVMAGNTESAERYRDVALRLDRKCFSAALASALLAAAKDDPETAQRILQVAMNQPIDADGPTIAEMLVKLGR